MTIKNNKGQAALESLLVLPVLLSSLFIVSYTFYYFYVQTLASNYLEESLYCYQRTKSNNQISYQSSYQCKILLDKRLNKILLLNEKFHSSFNVQSHFYSVDCWISFYKIDWHLNKKIPMDLSKLNEK